MTTTTERAAVVAPTPDAPKASPWSATDRVTLLALMAFTFILSAWNIGGFPRYAEDEGVYASQAQAVLDSHNLSPYWYWYDHPPVAWVLMAPFIRFAEMIGFGNGAMGAARFAPLVALTISAGLLYGIARRMNMRNVFAVATVLVFVLSPLVQEQLRKVYIDNISLPWILLAVFLALGKERTAWQFVQAGAATAVAVLCKETSVVMLPVILAMAVAWSPLRWHKALGSVLAPFAMVMALYPLYALVRGELGNLVETLRWQLSGRTGSGALWETDSLRQNVVTGWFDLDAVLIVGGLLAAAVLVFIPRYRWLSLTLLIPVLFVVRPSGYLPGMFINIFTPFLALALVAVVALIASRLPDRMAGIAGLVAVVLLVPASLVRLGSDQFLTNGNVNQDQAVEWIMDNTPGNSTVLVDDTTWQQLHQAGRDDVWKQTVLVYKLDTDPTAKEKLPRGWADIDYLVLTPTLRGSLDSTDLVQGREALANSVSMETFGTGGAAVEVRRVVPLAGLTPPPASDCSAGYVNLSFDDGPSGNVTSRILDILKAKGVHATFFVVGKNAVEHPEILKREIAEGHQVGNHSWDHTRFSTLTEAQQKDQIMRTEKVLEDAGATVTKFRTPYGETLPFVQTTIHKLGLNEVSWDVDVKDWSNPPSDAIVTQIVKQSDDGGTVLMHDIYTLNTVEALPKAIDGLYSEHFCIR